jgi:hypothetical protein
MSAPHEGDLALPSKWEKRGCGGCWRGWLTLKLVQKVLDVLHRGITEEFVTQAKSGKSNLLS